ncbi:MAG: MBL fold metallo-hydrolase [Pyrodictiaceae archaeon]
MVRILGADSFGSRSMATVVEASGVKIVIDPGVSYAPRRYGLPPHPREIERFCEIKHRIVDELSDADIVIISHYHYDHYLYKSKDIQYYRNKILLIKNPVTSINVSQRLRAHKLLKKYGLEAIAKEVKYIDNASYSPSNGLIIRGSSPVPHGSSSSRLGYVVMTCIKCCGYSFLHASDVQGPIEGLVVSMMLECNPDIIYLSGPPIYLKGVLGEELISRAFDNLEHLLASLRKEAVIIVDHHMARDLSYTDKLQELKAMSANILSAAEYMGRRIELLEALRRELWGDEVDKDLFDQNIPINCD